MRELPLLNESLCIRCGDCAAICPTACLENVPSGPWLARPLDCIACTACMLICPVEAIRMAPCTPA